MSQARQAAVRASIAAATLSKELRNVSARRMSALVMSVAIARGMPTDTLTRLRALSGSGRLATSSGYDIGIMVLGVFEF